MYLSSITVIMRSSTSLYDVKIHIVYLSVWIFHEDVPAVVLEKVRVRVDAGHHARELFLSHAPMDVDRMKPLYWSCSSI